MHGAKSFFFLIHVLQFFFDGRSVQITSVAEEIIFAYLTSHFFLETTSALG
jgi:hypothetical protein